ncbi:ATP-binding protein [Streptomyces sulfonofaciens]|uniref:ATP-binding protein n=1 Tax=Streptomyces sulfonofaciens TaxID=68272 RepID=A0A919FP48_9ACTN|nr:ATP-binding protein [Streptomyces sulfonofaciens]GHH69259.1 ATP-binding protein [Streptomyces sulfonofaciens]
MGTNEKRFSAHPASVAHAREWVVGALARRDLLCRADDIRLCVSELATNAIAHTTTRRRRFAVHLAFAGEALRIEVHDTGDGNPHLRRPSADEDHGRGLLLVAALADAWGSAPRCGPGKCVWAEFQLGTPQPAAVAR